MVRKPSKNPNRRKALSMLGSSIAGFSLLGSTASASDITNFDPYDPNEVREFVTYLENHPETYEEILRQLDDERRAAVRDAYTVAYTISTSSYEDQSDPEKFEVDVINKNVGKKWDWGKRPNGLKKAKRKQGASPEESRTETTEPVDTLVSNRTYTDSVRAVSYLGFTVYKWFHRVNWDYNSSQVSNVRPQVYTSNVSVVWSYEGVIKSSLTYNSSRSVFTSFKQGKFIGPGIDNTRYTTNPLIEIKGNQYGSGWTTLKQTY